MKPEEQFWFDIFYDCEIYNSEEYPHHYYYTNINGDTLAEYDSNTGYFMINHNIWLKFDNIVNKDFYEWSKFIKYWIEKNLELDSITVFNHIPH